MKAGLPINEPKRLQRWKGLDIYGRLREARRGAKKFILHDGPPYANGHIHMGTALNKMLKDFIVRVKTMEGLDAPYVPGWDCHGLPIEHQVDLELGKEKNIIAPSEKRQRCRAFAEKYVRIQREEFERLGTYGTWDSPYLTMDHSFEAATVRELGKFLQAGSVYRGLKPVHWCTSDLTALAEAEVEYEDHTSPSIYVAFPYVRGAETLNLPRNTEVVIWTTTPWTLPANLAVAFHPDYEYALVEVSVKGKTRQLVLAERLLPTLIETFEVTEHRTLQTFPGKSLEGSIFQHPFLDRESIGVLADYVTLEQGTGVVHTAPGHGREDYETGQKYGLGVLSPVDDYGRFHKDLSLFGDMTVWDANPRIIEHLKSIDALIAQELIKHTYPHCWRCHNPVIFRATPQWFIAMENNRLREKALKEIRRVDWLPAWGQERIYSMVENRPDWCISRQRTWGVPITAFSCSNCDEAIIDPQIAELAAEWMEKEGADAWFDRDISDFTPDGLTCTKCGSKNFEKVIDILDVWFDSGVTHAAVLESDNDLSWPADLYLEGSDQHRGWFHSSLLASVGTRDRAPYNTILTHGYVVDADGRKMSKSLGNVISPLDIVKQSGAEIIRLWVASENYREDVRISQEILKRNSEAYRRIRNTFRFLLGNLYDFDVENDAVSEDLLNEIDRFMLHKLAKLTQRVRTAYSQYEFHVFYQTFHNFCAVDLSAFYLDVIKDRLYVENSKSEARRGAQTVMHKLADTMVRLMAPILPFTADEIWDCIPNPTPNREPSVSLTLLPEPDESHLDEKLCVRWERLLELRDSVLKALEETREKKELGSALNAKIVISASEEFLAFLKPYLDDLPMIFIVSRVEVEIATNSNKSNTWTVQVEHAEGEKCERCWMVLPTIGQNSIHPTLCHRCATILG